MKTKKQIKKHKKTKHHKPAKHHPKKQLHKKARIKTTLSDSKIFKLLNLEHLEELFYLINILSDEQIEAFIQHYKKAGRNAPPKLDSIIKNSITKHDLLEALKKELVSFISDEYKSLRDKISQIRKKGIDTYIEDIKSMSIPLKIRIFSATAKKEDFYKVKKIIHDINFILESKKIDMIQEKKEEKQDGSIEGAEAEGKNIKHRRNKE